MAVVEAVSIGKDGLVRSCKVGYGVPHEAKDIHCYTGRRWVSITHSIQRLSLLLAVEEQTETLTMEDSVMKLSEDKAAMEEGEAAESVKTLAEMKLSRL